MVPVMPDLAAEQSVPVPIQHKEFSDTDVAQVLLQMNCYNDTVKLLACLYIRCQFKGLSTCIVTWGTLKFTGNYC